MQVTVQELREVSRILFDHLVASGASEVTIDADYYWNVPGDQVYRPDLEVVVPDMGQLSEDWNELSRIRTGHSPPVGLALVWLAAIVRAVGESAEC